ncbi:MAG: hypothetical protein KJ941_09655 [Bacteroidetes bacterium]|nr:hypothetical protein [Bacteroidota bacterium]
MKIISKIMLVSTLVLAFSATSFSQFTFTVSPGIGMNSASFGYRFGNFVPYAGFQFLNAKFKTLQTGQEYDSDKNAIVNYENLSEFSGGLYMPNLGLKYFLIEKNGLKTYLSLNVTKPIIAARLTLDGEQDTEFKEEVQKVSIWGGEFGFGMEYFFSENFSLGGEFGVRYAHVRYKDTYETTVYNPNTNEFQESETEFKFTANISPTFSKVALNFYF